MPPRRRRKDDSKGSQSTHSSLLDLPLPALSLIYKHCDVRARKALLRVSTGCWGWVVREVRSIDLHLPSTVTAAARKPLARLLHRACNQSACSLALRLNFRFVDWQKNSNNTLMADLLKPGIEQSGWPSVAKLELWVRKVSC
jgi:hypothetical protein